MLTDDLQRVRSQPGPAVLTLAVGLLIGVLIGMAFIGNGGDATTTSSSAVAVRTVVAGAAPSTLPAASAGTNGSGQGGVPQPGATQSQKSTAKYSRDQLTSLRNALAGGVRAANALGGRAEAAISISGVAPMVSPASAVARPSRMWSQAKAVAAVAAYSLNPRPSPLLRQAVQAAITRSENCAERRVVIGMQKLAENAHTSAAHSFEEILKRAGASATIPTAAAPAEASCLPYLRAHAGGLNPEAPAIQFGTATWSVRDGANFALALAAGKYGSAGEKVYHVMQEPKARSQDPGVKPSDYTVSALDWGAGRAFRGFSPAPAYKAGWGEKAGTHPFLVAQIVSLRLPGDVWVGIAAAFHPNEQPAQQDPGRTPGPAAMEAIFRPIAVQLRVPAGVK